MQGFQITFIAVENRRRTRHSMEHLFCVKAYVGFGVVGAMTR